jgi:hypothetical protein
MTRLPTSSASLMTPCREESELKRVLSKLRPGTTFDDAVRSLQRPTARSAGLRVSPETSAVRELFPVVEKMGTGAQRWLRHDLVDTDARLWSIFFRRSLFCRAFANKLTACAASRASFVRGCIIKEHPGVRGQTRVDYD